MRFATSTRSMPHCKTISSPAAGSSVAAVGATLWTRWPGSTPAMSASASSEAPMARDRELQGWRLLSAAARALEQEAIDLVDVATDDRRHWRPVVHPPDQLLFDRLIALSRDLEAMA